MRLKAQRSEGEDASNSQQESTSLFEFESVVHLLIYIQYEHGRAISANRCLMNSVVWNGHAMEVVQPLFFFHCICCCCVLSHSV